MENPPTTDMNRNLQGVLIFMMLVISSVHFVFARIFAGLVPPATSAFFVLFSATIEFGVYMVVTRQLRWQPFVENMRFYLLIGALVAGSTIMNYAAVEFIDAGTASLLSRTSIVFGILFGVFWLRERFTRVEWIGATLCVFGAFTISFQQGDYLRLGSLLVVGGALFYALHAAIVKKEGSDIDFGNFFFYRIAATSFFILIFSFPLGGIEIPVRESWLVLLIAGTIDVVVSRVLYYWALRQMRLGLHTVVLTASPVVTILLSLLIFGESPTMQALIGGAIVLTGIVIITLQSLKS